MEVESSINFLFSEDSTLFAQVESGINIRVSEVNTKKDYNYILDSDPSSSTVSEICKVPGSNKNLLIIGNEQGSIKVINYKSKSTESELEGHQAAVLALKAHGEANSLFSVSADKKIIKWDLSSLQEVERYNIERKGTASVASCDLAQEEENLLVSLDNVIVQYNMQQKKAEKKFKGHSTQINFLKSATGSKYFASCSNDDVVYVWSSEKDAPVLSLPISSQTYTNLDFCKVSKGLFLVLLSSASHLKLWLLRATKSEVQVKSAVNLRFQEKNLLQAKISDKRSVIIALKGNNRPRFHVISLFHDSESVELNDQDTIIHDINSAIGEGLRSPTESPQKKKSKDKGSYVVAETKEVISQPKPLKTAVEDSGEKSKGKNGNGFFLLDAIKNKKTDETVQTEVSGTLGSVLAQALQNNDDKLLSYCFNNEDEELVENTIRKLSQSKLAALLDKIIERIEAIKDGDDRVFAWLNFLARHHSGFLVKTQETAGKITPLIAALQKRALPRDQIYRIKGKIEMIVEMENETRRQKKTPKKLSFEHKPLVEYEEVEKEEKVEKKKKKGKGEVGQAKPSKGLGYTRAMEEMEVLEESKEDKEFSDSVSESDDEDEDIDEEYDAYLQPGADDYDEEGEDDDKESEEDEDDEDYE